MWSSNVYLIRLFFFPIFILFQEKVPEQLENMHTMYFNNATAFAMYEPFKDKLNDLVPNAETYASICTFVSFV